MSLIIIEAKVFNNINNFFDFLCFGAFNLASRLKMPCAAKITKENWESLIVPILLRIGSLNFTYYANFGSRSLCSAPAARVVLH